jgi:hypothetical protein
VTCAPVPAWSNVEGNSTEVSIGSVVEVWCQAGFALQAATNITSVTCMPTGDWYPAIPQCTGFSCYPNVMGSLRVIID